MSKQMSQRAAAQTNNAKTSGGSPTHSNSSGSKVKRELWWHQSVSEKKVLPEGGLPKFEVGPKIDAKSNWSPSKSQKKIETQKLEWNVGPVLNTKENINYSPGGIRNIFF